MATPEHESNGYINKTPPPLFHLEASPRSQERLRKKYPDQYSRIEKALDYIFEKHIPAIKQQFERLYAQLRLGTSRLDVMFNRSKWIITEGRPPFSYNRYHDCFYVDVSSKYLQKFTGSPDEIDDTFLEPIFHEYVHAVMATLVTIYPDRPSIGSELTYIAGGAGETTMYEDTETEEWRENELYKLLEEIITIRLGLKMWAYYMRQIGKYDHVAKQITSDQTKLFQELRSKKNLDNGTLGIYLLGPLFYQSLIEAFAEHLETDTETVDQMLVRAASRHQFWSPDMHSVFSKVLGNKLKNVLAHAKTPRQILEIVKDAKLPDIDRALAKRWGAVLEKASVEGT